MGVPGRRAARPGGGHREPLVRRPDVPPPRRRRDPRDRRDPAGRHVDLHGGRRRRGSTSSGAPRSSSSWRTDSAAGPGWSLLRALLVGVIFGSRLRHRPPARTGRADRRPADARGVRRRRRSRSRCARSSSGWRSSRWSCCWSSTGGPTRARLWLVPVIVAVWANMHGSFFLGPRGPRASPGSRTSTTATRALAAVLAVDGDQRRSPPASTRSARPSGATPSACPRTRWSPQRITEWQPTSLRTIPGILFFGSAAAIVVLIARRGGPHRLADARLARGLLRHRRLRDPRRRVVAARRRSPRSPARSWSTGRRTAEAASIRRSIRRANLAIAVVLVVVGVALLPVWRPIEPGLGGAGRGRRQRAAGHHRRPARDGRQPGDRLFDAAAVGLVVRVQPAGRSRSAIDSRIELFPVERLGRLRAGRRRAPTAGRTGCGPGA